MDNDDVLDTAIKFCNFANRLRRESKGPLPDRKIEATGLTNEGKRIPIAVEIIRDHYLTPIQTGVMAIAKFLVSRKTARLSGDNFPDILNNGMGTDRIFVSKIAIFLADKVLRASRFLEILARFPGGFELEPLQTQATIADLIALTPTVDMHDPRRDQNPHFWVMNGLWIDEAGFRFLRDWIDTYGNSGQMDAFYRRFWNPIHEYAHLINVRLLNGSEPWPECREEIIRLQDVYSWLMMFANSLTHPKGKSVQLPSADQWGTPVRLVRLADTIRNENRRLSTAELAEKYGCDPNLLLAPARGCSKQDRAWADRHLRDGRGFWKWKPPVRPSNPSFTK